MERLLNVGLEEVLHFGLDGVEVRVRVGIIGSVVVLGEGIQLILLLGGRGGVIGLCKIETICIALASKLSIMLCTTVTLDFLFSHTVC